MVYSKINKRMLVISGIRYNNHHTSNGTGCRTTNATCGDHRIDPGFPVQAGPFGGLPVGQQPSPPSSSEYLRAGIQ
jgi:hypothetical protein